MLRDKYPIPIHTIESQLHGIRQLTKGPSQFKSLTKSIRELSREREREEPKAFISQHVRQFHSPNPSFPSKKKKTTHYVSVLSENDPQLANSFGYLHKIYCIIVR